MFTKPTLILGSTKQQPPLATININDSVYNRVSNTHNFVADDPRFDIISTTYNPFKQIIAVCLPPIDRNKIDDRLIYSYINYEWNTNNANRPILSSNFFDNIRGLTTSTKLTQPQTKPTEEQWFYINCFFDQLEEQAYYHTHWSNIVWHDHHGRDFDNSEHNPAKAQFSIRIFKELINMEWYPMSWDFRFNTPDTAEDQQYIENEYSTWNRAYLGMRHVHSRTFGRPDSIQQQRWLWFQQAVQTFIPWTKWELEHDTQWFSNNFSTNIYYPTENKPALIPFLVQTIAQFYAFSWNIPLCLLPTLSPLLLHPLLPVHLHTTEQKTSAIIPTPKPSTRSSSKRKRQMLL